MSVKRYVRDSGLSKAIGRLLTNVGSPVRIVGPAFPALFWRADPLHHESLHRSHLRHTVHFL
jgi:hypothetical protein